MLIMTLEFEQIHTLRITMESFHRWCIHLLHPRIRNFNHWIYHLRTRFLVHHLDLLDCFVSLLLLNCQSGGRFSGTERHLPFWANIVVGRGKAITVIDYADGVQEQ